MSGGVVIERLDLRQAAHAEVLAAVLSIERKSFSKADGWGDLLAREAARKNTVLLFARCEEGAGVAGYLLYANTGLVAHISKLAVAEGFRRRGVGAALVATAVEEARRGRRLQSLTLHVAEDNAPALALYRSQRFDTEGVLRDYYRPGRSAYKLRRELEID